MLEEMLQKAWCFLFGHAWSQWHHADGFPPDHFQQHCVGCGKTRWFIEGDEL